MNNQQAEIVEAEVIEQEETLQTENQDTKKSAKPAKKRSINLARMLVMLVSATALAIAMASWYQLQKLTQVWSDNLNQSKAAIVELQSSLTKLENQTSSTPTYQTSEEITLRLDEMQLVLKNLLQQEPQENSPNIEINEAKQEQLKELNQKAEAAIQELNKQLKLIEQITQEKTKEINNYLSSEDWEIDKKMMQETMEILGAQISTLSEDAMKHTEILEKLAPQIEKRFEEIQPRLQGLGARLNQLFSIRKYEPEDN